MHSPSSASAASDADTLALLGALPERFRAAAGADSSELSYSIARHPLRVRFAGSAMLERFAPALEHLRSVEADRTAHTVHVWDAASTGTEPPPILVPDGSAPGTVFTHSAGERRALYMVGLRSLSVYDPNANASWYWTADAGQLPSWECASPLRHVLHWWLAENGLQQVHAGSIGTERGAVLVAGRGGRGKSTTTLASLESGLKYLGDDYVAVEPTQPPYVHSIYSAGKLEPHHVERFPHLRDYATLADPTEGDFEPEKAILYVHPHFPDQCVPTLPLVAIVVPSIDSSQPTAVSPATRAEALRALAPSTLLQLHVGEQRLLSSLTALVARLPAYGLRLGPDVDRIGPVLASLIDEVVGHDA